MDIHDQLQNYEQSHKNQFKWFLVIVIISILVIVFLHFYGAGSKVMFSDDKTTKALMDSIRIHDKQSAIIFQQLSVIHQQDSIRIDNLEDDLSSTQLMINKLNSKYAKERTDLANSSVDNRLRFFSGHLPQSGSNR